VDEVDPLAVDLGGELRKVVELGLVRAPVVPVGPIRGMLETSARLLRLLSLLQARREWTGGELAERLAITPRTVRRDVEKLRGLGYPVEATPGVAGGYRLGRGASMPPLLLDDEEAVAVAVGLRTAAGGSVTGLAETSLRALAKLEQLLPARLRHRVTAVHAAVVPMPARGPAVDADALISLAAACRDNLRARFGYRADYRSGQERQESLRNVEPHRLVHTGRLWYLIGFDLDRQDWRTFRVDRMRLWTPTGPRFTPREPPPDLPGYVSQSLSTAPYRYQAKILMHAPLAVVAERTSPSAGRLVALDEHTCVLLTGSNSLDELALYVAIKGVDFEVLEPPELLAKISELADRLQKARAGTPSAGASQPPASRTPGDPGPASA
jgi:predicted DNA-binding transcriptional regulator YafY